MDNGIAPGHPGIPPRWTSSAKSGVGTAISGLSHVWFTISHGIVNEVYYPEIDQANTRDFGLLITDGSQFFSEEKRDTTCEILPLAQGVPGYRLTNTCAQGRYRIEKVIVTDPLRDVLLQRVRFEAVHGRLSDYQVYALLAPHIGNAGYGNTGWSGEYKGLPMLFAQRGDTTLALACPGGLIPEQVWDAADIQGRELSNGRPSGSAMPLVWAHAEYVKLVRSLRDGRVFDTPPQTVQRYQVEKVRAKLVTWRFNHKCRRMPAGKVLRVEVLTPAMVHWSLDDWQTVHQTQTTDTRLGIHFADLPTDQLPRDRSVRFTFFWRDAERWEGGDFDVTVADERRATLARGRRAAPAE